MSALGGTPRCALHACRQQQQLLLGCSSQPCSSSCHRQLAGPCDAAAFSNGCAGSAEPFDTVIDELGCVVCAYGHGLFGFHGTCSSVKRTAPNCSSWHADSSRALRAAQQIPPQYSIMAKQTKQSFSRINKRHEVIAQLKKWRGDVSKVISATGFTAKYVRFWVQRYQNTGSVYDSPKSGRPRVLSASQVAAVVKTVEQEDSVPAAAAVLKRKGSIPRNVSEKTIRRALEAELDYKAVVIEPKRTKQAIKKRVQFSRHRHPAKRIAALDSTILNTAGSGRRRKVWVKKGTQRVIQKVRKGQKLHVYGAITRYGATPLIRVTGTTGLPKQYMKKDGKLYDGVCAKEFQDTMRKHLLPKAERILRKHTTAKGVYLIDGAPAHTAKTTKNFLRSRNIQYLQDWPPNSPDLNPIENAWAWLKHHVYKKQSRNIAELWRHTKQQWAQLTPKQCAKYMGSFNRRKQLCAQRKGGHTGY